MGRTSSLYATWLFAARAPHSLRIDNSRQDSEIRDERQEEARADMGAAGCNVASPNPSQRLRRYNEDIGIEPD